MWLPDVFNATDPSGCALRNMPVPRVTFGKHQHAGMDPQLIAEFTVPGRPVPKARPRVSQDRRGRNRTHTDAKTVEHEELVARCFLEATRRRYVDPAWRYRVDLDFYGAHASADFDNLIKCVADGLNTYAWKDDKQVKTGSWEVHEGPCKQPRTEIRVYRIA